MTACIYAIATMDTKGAEIRFVCDRLLAAGTRAKTVDVGTKSPPTVTPDVTREHVLGGVTSADRGDRGESVAAMSAALTAYLVKEHEAGNVAGVLGIGGSGGTALITAAMRALPVGLPKVMVSTVASGNTAPYVDSSDITMINSVVDIAGLNRVSQHVLANAAHAMAGMAWHEVPVSETRPAVGMTMFGVTTPCVDQVRNALSRHGFDCLVFHATGTGGRAMEKLVESGMIQGVLDITTTEVADEVVGGVFPAGKARFDTILQHRIPYVMSLGALDMVNFGEMGSVAKRFQHRNLHAHNAQVTLMRTTPDENREIARWIAGKLNRAEAPVVVLIPEGGVSMLDAPGQPFYDREADLALFHELAACLDQDELRRIIRLPYHINEPEFAERLVHEFLNLN